MKTINRIILMVLLIFMMIGCTGCSTECKQETNISPQTIGSFTVIETGPDSDYYIVYNMDTRVMYSVSNGHYNKGTFTLLVNPDGTPQIFPEENEGI